MSLKHAFEAADGRDVRLGGGVATIQQYLGAGLVDEMHVAVSPVLLASGEQLFAGVNLPDLVYERSEYVATANAAHFVLTRKGG